MRAWLRGGYGGAARPAQPDPRRDSAAGPCGVRTQWPGPREVRAIRLQIYVLRELLAAFGLLFAIVTAIVGAGLLLQFVTSAPELGFGIVAQALLYILPEAFPITLPLSFLVACLLVYGRFSDDNEFLATRMGGIHPWHVVVPAVMVGAFLAVFTVWLNTDVLPWAGLGKRELRTNQIEQLVASIEKGSATSLPLGKKLRFSAASRADDGAFLDVHITGDREAPKAGVDSSDPGASLFAGGEVQAKRAWLWLDRDERALVLKLEDALWVRQGVQGRWTENTFALPLDRLVDASPREQNKRISLLSGTELLYRIRRGSPDAKEQRAVHAELWQRISMGLAPLVFAFLGAPLGLFSARGSRASAFLTGLVIALPVYYPLVRIGENAAREGQLPAPVALLFADVLLAGIGGWLFVRVVRT